MPKSYFCVIYISISQKYEVFVVLSTMLPCQHTKFLVRFLVSILLVSVVFVYYYKSVKRPTNKLVLLENKIKNLLTVQTVVTNAALSTVSVQKSNALSFGNGSAKLKLAVVLCGDVLNQTIVNLKSAVISTKCPLHIIIVADNENQVKVRNEVLAWPRTILYRISLEIHPITFPDDNYGEEWKKLFKLCACQRLFLPSLLSHIDSLIYMDTDIIFMHPVEDLWQFFDKMNDNQIAGLAPEHEDFATGWYNRFARHPYYEPLGVNSGVMLMNLTRMRKFNWQMYLQPILKEYKMKIVWGDQDIINIIFHFHSDKLYIFPCEWNFRPDHCMYSSVCKTIEKNGVKIIHGNRGVYHNDKQPVFKAIYNVMSNYKVGTDLETGLIQPLQYSISKETNTNCGKIGPDLIKGLLKTLNQMKTKVQR